MRLTTKRLRDAERKEETGRWSDGGRGSYGLYALAQRRKGGNGVAIRFCQRIRIQGQTTNIGIGPFPGVSVEAARKAALKNWLEAREGGDPRREAIPMVPRAEVASGTRVDTLAEILADHISLHGPDWSASTLGQWRAIPMNHFPKLLPKPVDRIDRRAVIEVLRAAPDSQRERARNMLSALFQVAIVEGLRTTNPADKDILKVLPRKKACGNLKSIHWQDAPGAYAKLAAVDTAEAPAARMAMLTASRPNEVTGMTWAELDGDVWTVPGERMKAGRAHRVALSGAALEIIRAQRQRTEGSEYVFPSAKGKLMARARVSEQLRKLDIPSTTHGFRSSFRSWCADQGVQREVAEAALAHVVGGVEGAYQRSDYLEARRELMERWAAYLAA